MEIGVSTATLFLRAYNEDALPLLDGIDSRIAEIFLESFCEYTEDYARLLKSRLGSLKVHSVHTLNTHFEPQLFSINERARGDALKFFTEVVKSAKIFGADYYTFHGPMRFKKNSVFNRYDEYVKRFNVLTDICNEYGLKLCLENVEWAIYGSVGFFDKIKDRCPELMTCLDIKQAKISGYNYRDYISEMGERIKTVHLSDFDENGKIVLPGYGKFDFKELFERLRDYGFNGNMLIEVYKESFNDVKEISQSLKYLRNIKSEVFGK